MVKSIKPRPAQDVEYPTLSQFTQDRRRFLKGLAAGALCLGAGSLVAACTEEEEGENHSRDAGRDADLGLDFSVDHSDSQETTGEVVEEPVDDTEEEWEGPLPGDAPMPEYFTVRLPATGTVSTYLADYTYITFAVSFVTENLSLAEHYEENRYLGLLACIRTLCEESCDSFSDESLATNGLFGRIADQLMADYGEQTGRSAWGVLSVEFQQLDCHPAHELLGDIEMPEFPEVCTN